MNIKFKKICLLGFKSFSTYTEFNLERGPGLYFISGENQFEPEQESNGAGKTTLFDALCWVLHNKTLVGVKAGHIISWGSKTCKVEILLSIDNSTHSIIRTQSPNTLLLDGKETTQSVIDDLIKIDYENFRSSVIIGQFHESFLDKQPRDKLKIFSEIMDLEFWETCSTKADTQAKILDRELVVLQEKRNGYENNIKSQVDNCALLQTKSDNFEVERNTNIANVQITTKELTREIDRWIVSKDLLEGKLNNLKLEVTEHKTLHKSLTDQLENIQAEKNSLETQSRSIGLKLVEITTNINAEKKNYDKWRGLKGQCPTCLQQISTEIASAEKAKINRQIMALKEQSQIQNDLKAGLDSQVQEVINKRVPLQSEYSKVAQKIMYLESNTLDSESIYCVEQDISKANTQIALKQQTLKQNQDQIELLAQQTNPYLDLIKSSTKQVEQFTNDLTTTKESIILKSKEYEGYNYWVKGFKDLRLWLISDALLSLEIESNNALSEFGLSEWSLKFTIEKETTTGSISRGLYILVGPKSNNTEPVLIETLSGGQLQRIKLAIIMGMSSLIANYKGFNSNIEVMDEPSAHLSQSGIDDLIGFLRERANRLDKTIFYVDHHNLSNENFNSVIKVKLNEKGQSVIEE